jgi:hypothetical protein
VVIMFADSAFRSVALTAELARNAATAVIAPPLLVMPMAQRDAAQFASCCSGLPLPRPPEQH